MQEESPQEQLSRLVNDQRDLIRRLASETSIARLLADNQPIGDLVIYSLIDDGLVYSDLWARLKIISDWLKATEEIHKKQFPDDFPKLDKRYDLANKPTNFRSRLDIFKSQVEAFESGKLWSTEVVLNDPVAVIKRLKELGAKEKKLEPNAE